MSRKSGVRYIALTTCVIGFSGVAFALIILREPLWAIWPIAFSLPPLGAIIKEEKETKNG